MRICIGYCTVNVIHLEPADRTTFGHLVVPIQVNQVDLAQ